MYMCRKKSSSRKGNLCFSVKMKTKQTNKKFVRQNPPKNISKMETNQFSVEGKKRKICCNEKKKTKRKKKLEPKTNNHITNSESI